MIQDIRFHGKIDSGIEYYATVAGFDVVHRCFYEYYDDGGQKAIRFFSSGNEFAIGKNGIRYRGTGGIVAEYMFGSDQPLEDLFKKDVLNRLVMHGTVFSSEGGKRTLKFTGINKGAESYEKVFLEGNAVRNYFFIIQSQFDGDIAARQESILRAVGKTLKRSMNVGEHHDAALIREILDALDEKQAIIYLFRLENIPHMKYQEVFMDYYSTFETLTKIQQERLDEIAEHEDISQYQQQRIKIDVIYKREENKKIIDEYKDILISCANSKLSDAKRARLKRLRTLSVRHNVPLTVFDTLDELLLEEKETIHEGTGEPEYIQRAREIFEGLFLEKQSIADTITNQDLMELLFSKRKATEDRDSSFEHILLETGRVCDETAAETGNITPLENFGYIITYFDRYDSTFSNINRLAFMDDAELSEDKLRSLLGNKREFDNLQRGFFNKLFCEPIVINKYISSYGRKKINAMHTGLVDVENNNASLQDVAKRIQKINMEEKLYITVRDAVKDRMKNFYSDLGTKHEQHVFREEISNDLIKKKIISGPVPSFLFEKVIVDIRKEGFYLHYLLPEIVKSRNGALREDFFINSGLDRFYIEEIESQYLELVEADAEVFSELREEEEG